MNLQRCLRLSQQIVTATRRNMVVAAANQMDPVQQLFFDQVKRAVILVSNLMSKEMFCPSHLLVENNNRVATIRVVDGITL